MISILAAAPEQVPNSAFPLAGLLAGGGMMAVIMLFWNTIKQYALKIFAFCITTTTFKTNKYNETHRIIIKKIMEQYRVGFFQNKAYGHGEVYDENVNSILMKPYYRKLFYNQNITLWRGFIPLFINITEDKIELTYLRKTFDSQKIFIEACNECNAHLMESSDQDYMGPGYTITRTVPLPSNGEGGSMSYAKESAEPDESKPKATSLDSSSESITNLITYKYADPLGWDSSILSPKQQSSGSKGLILNGGASILESDIEQYLRSKKWFFDKGAPWNKGYLLYGDPGTGKTSLVRHIAKKFRLPIYVFDLSTFNNHSLSMMWSQFAKNSNPKIFLIEDIDAVFNGRKNITDNGIASAKLTFDCLLNTIDGVDDRMNRILFVTTNKIELVDPALGGTFETDKIVSNNPDILELASRPGRIDRSLYMGNLNYEGYLAIAKFIMNEYANSEEIEQFTKNNHENRTPAQFKELCINFTIHRIYNGNTAS